MGKHFPDNFFLDNFFLDNFFPDNLFPTTPDIFLLGPPGPARRRLALAYCELLHREVEYLCVSPDVTESDIKQRREIKHKTAVYENAAAVRACLLGRVLVIDGIEKAVRRRKHRWLLLLPLPVIATAVQPRLLTFPPILARGCLLACSIYHHPHSGTQCVARH